MENVKKFAIQDIQEVRTEESDEFCYAKIKCLSTMENSHKVVITEDILRNNGDTVLGKWIICDTSLGENASHTNNQVIVGIVPRDSKVEYIIESDGNISMVVEAVISKIYAKPIYDMFKLYNERNVSCEFIAYDESEVDENGYTTISGFKIFAITVLGLAIKGSVPNANMKIVQFSEDKAEKYYNSLEEKSDLKKFVEKRKTQPKKEKEIKMEETMAEIVKTFAVDLDDLWCKLYDILRDKYPDEKDGYCSIYRIHGIYEEDGQKFAIIYTREDETMYKLNFGIEGNELIPSNEMIQVELTFVEKEGILTFEQEGKEEYMKFVKKEDEVKEKDIVMEEEKEVEIEEKAVEAEVEKTMEEDEDEKDDDSEEETEEFSLEKYATRQCSFEEGVKEFGESLLKMSADSVIETMVKLFNENSELKTFKFEIEKEQKNQKVSEIMFKVKDDLKESDYTKLFEEGKITEFSDLGYFENKVKAFAYEYTKNNKMEKTVEKEDGMLQFAIAEQVEIEPKKKGLWD